MKKRKAETRVNAGLDPVKTETGIDVQKASQVCQSIMEGNSLRVACAEAGISKGKFLRLLNEEAGPILDQYLRAREVRAHERSESIDEYKRRLEAGELDPHVAKVLIDATFRQMGKEAPKRYGDKIDVTTGGDKLPAQVQGMMIVNNAPEV